MDESSVNHVLRSTRNQCALSVMEERVALSVVYANPTNVQVVQGRIDRYQIHPYELVTKAHHRVHENFTKLIRFVQD